MWVHWRYRKTGQMPICAFLCRSACCRPPTEGPVFNHNGLAGGLKKGLTSPLPSASETLGPSTLQLRQRYPLLNLALRMRRWRQSKSNIT